MGGNEEAEHSYDNAIKINPDDLMAWNNKGRLTHDIGKYKVGVDCYNKALQINLNIGQIWYNQGLSFEIMKKGKGFRINNLDKSHFKDKFVSSPPDYVTVLQRKNVIIEVWTVVRIRLMRSNYKLVDRL